MQLVALSQMTVRKNRLLFAAVAAVGASVVAVNPMAPLGGMDVRRPSRPLRVVEPNWRPSLRLAGSIFPTRPWRRDVPPCQNTARQTATK